MIVILEETRAMQDALRVVIADPLIIGIVGARVAIGEAWQFMRWAKSVAIIASVRVICRSSAL